MLAQNLTIQLWVPEVSFSRPPQLQILKTPTLCAGFNASTASEWCYLSCWCCILAHVKPLTRWPKRSKFHKQSGPHGVKSLSALLLDINQVSLLVKACVIRREHLSATVWSALSDTKLDARTNKAPRIQMYCSTKQKLNISTRRSFVWTQNGHMLACF